jgi:hypothetical protein
VDVGPVVGHHDRDDDPTASFASWMVVDAALHRRAKLFEEFVEFAIGQPKRNVAKADQTGGALRVTRASGSGSALPVRERGSLHTRCADLCALGPGVRFFALGRASPNVGQDLRQSRW